MRRALAITAVAAVSALGAVGFVAAQESPAPTGPTAAEVANQKLRAQIKKERKVSTIKQRRAYARGRQSIVVRTDVQHILRVVAISRGLDPRAFRNRAGCETGWTFNPRVVNSSSGVKGLFQFQDSTWTGFTRVGAAGLDVKDALTNALGASEMLSRGLHSHWDCNASGVAKSRGGANT